MEGQVKALIRRDCPLPKLTVPVQGTPPCNRSSDVLRRLLDDRFHPGAVDVEFAGNGSLAGTAFVPYAYRLLQHWRRDRHGWRLVLENWSAGALGPDHQAFAGRPVIGLDEHHESLEGADPRPALATA